MLFLKVLKTHEPHLYRNINFSLGIVSWKLTETQPSKKKRKLPQVYRKRKQDKPTIREMIM
jgi:hypothetical protein